VAADSKQESSMEVSSSGSAASTQASQAAHHASTESQHAPGSSDHAASGAPASTANGTPASTNADHPSSTLSDMAKDGTAEAVRASAVDTGATAELAAGSGIPPGVIGGAGVGIWTGSNKPMAGDHLLKDPATRSFFMDKSPALNEHYQLDLKGPLNKVSPEYFSDTKVRSDTYLSEVRQLPDRYAIPKDASVDIAEAKSQGANQARNTAMDATREQISERGRGYSEALKERGLEWQSLADKGAQKAGLNSYADATPAQKVAINEGIVSSSGRTNVHVDALVAEAGSVSSSAKFLRGANMVGKGLTVVGAAVDAYSLGSEVNKSLETGNWENTAKEGTRIGVAWAAAAGGAQLGATIGSFGGPVGTVVGGLVGGAAGYLVGSGAVEAGWNAAKSIGSSVAGWFS
jgi:hypothetical protein